MGEIGRLEKRIWANKVAKSFNTTNIEREFNYTYAELAEAYDTYRKGTPGLGEELADVIIFVLGLAHMAGVDIEKEITEKVKKNEDRKYKEHNGHHIRIENDKENLE